MSIYGNKYDNWTDWKTDPRKQCMIDGHECDISHYYWNFYNPDDKICYGDGYDIDHDNGDHSDNSKKNLIKRTHGNHSSRHKKGENHPMFGKKHSPETIEKLKGENNPMYGKKHTPETIEKMRKVKYKPVVANFIEYSSRNEAAEALGVDPSTITYRIKTNKPGYFYVSDFMKDFEENLTENLKGVI